MRRGLQGQAGIGKASRVLTDAGPQRSHLNLGHGDHSIQLLRREAAATGTDGDARRGRHRGLAQRLNLLGLLLLEIAHQSTRTEHVGVLVREPLQQIVELAPLCIQSRIDFRRRDADGRFLQQALRRQVGALRLLAGERSLRRVASVFCLAQFQARLLELAVHFAQTRGRVAPFANLHVEVAQPKVLQARLGFLQFGLVALDLIVDKDLGRIRILAAGPQTRLDEDRRQRLNRAFGSIRFGIAVGKQVQVVAACPCDAQRLHQLVDRGILLRLRLVFQVEVGHSHQLFNIRPADQGSAQHGNLLVDVWLDRQTGHQRLQYRQGIDMDPRAGLILVRDPKDDYRPDQRDTPGDQYAQPAVLPHAARGGVNLGNHLLHIHRS